MKPQTYTEWAEARARQSAQDYKSAEETMGFIVFFIVAVMGALMMFNV
jgi:hypothetical protein